MLQQKKHNNQHIYSISPPNPLKQLFSQNRSPRSHNLPGQRSKSKIKQIGKYGYCENDIIGDGYTSKVYKCFQLQKPKTKYALKVINTKKLNEEQMKLIRNQLELHPKLNHQNIVKCYDVIEQGNYLYIVLELCPHGDLNTYIQEIKNISQLKAIQILQQILEGYKYLIKENILHRDLKPANILRSGKTLKIADFGFAVQGKKSLIDNISVGTPLYMPPESIQQCVYTHKTDFFSIGCILYELLHGRTPWYKNNQRALVKMMKSQPIDVSKIKDNNIKRFILAACHINQGARLSIDEFLSFNVRQPLISQIPDLYLQKCSKNSSSSRNIRGFLQATERQPNQIRKQQMISAKSRKSSMTMETTTTSHTAFLKSAKEKQTQRMAEQFQDKFKFCLRLKYLIENSNNCVLLEQNQKKCFKILAFRHCIFMLKKILNDIVRNKSHDIEQWQKYKHSQQFKCFEKECQLMKEKIQKSFNLELKGMSLKNLSQINRKFSELSYSLKLTPKFHENLGQFLRTIIRQFNLQLMKLPKGETLKKQKAKYFEAFKNIYFFYEWNQQQMKDKTGDQKIKKLNNVPSLSNFVSTAKNGPINQFSNKTQLFNSESYPNSAKKIHNHNNFSQLAQQIYSPKQYKINNFGNRNFNQPQGAKLQNSFDLLRDYTQSKMTVQDMSALKKKIKWLW